MSDTPLPTLMLDPELGFAYGTRVHTKEGLKPIESICSGDRVLTHSKRTPPPRRRRHLREYQYRQVVRATHIEVQAMVRITLRNLTDGIDDTWLAATGQPIWTQPPGWLAAQHLRRGQAAVLSFNGNALVSEVQVSDRPAHVCHLEVEDGNTYYVEQLGTWVGCDSGGVVQIIPLQRRCRPSTSASRKCCWRSRTTTTDRQITLQAPPTQGYTVSSFLTGVKCFYVCSPSGQLLHSEWINRSDWDTLPPEILKQLKSKLPAVTTLTLNQLERGKQFIQVSYSASDKQSDDRHCYSTTLQNTFSRKVRITKFGGFRNQEGAWHLASVTGDFYTADQFREWYRREGEWLLPGETVCDATNWGNPPVLWAYYGVADTGESFIAGKVLERPVDSPGSSSGTHFVKPVQPQPEMEQIINGLRASYELRQQRMNTLTLASLTGPRPFWLTETDGLVEFFEQQDLLLTEGHVVWGALVQANKLLFTPGDADCPGLLVHSPDSYFDARPQELRLIGRTFFSFKETEPTDTELAEVARLVTDEMDRSMGFDLPTVLFIELGRLSAMPIASIRHPMLALPKAAVMTPLQGPTA